MGDVGFGPTRYDAAAWERWYAGKGTQAAHALSACRHGHSFCSSSGPPVCLAPQHPYIQEHSPAPIDRPYKTQTGQARSNPPQPAPTRSTCVGGQSWTHHHPARPPPPPHSARSAARRAHRFTCCLDLVSRPFIWLPSALDMGEIMRIRRPQGLDWVQSCRPTSHSSRSISRFPSSGCNMGLWFMPATTHVQPIHTSSTTLRHAHLKHGHVMFILQEVGPGAVLGLASCRVVLLPHQGLCDTCEQMRKHHACSESVRLNLQLNMLHLHDRPDTLHPAAF